MLSCGCDFEGDLDLPFYYIPNDFQTCKSFKKVRCVSCKKPLKRFDLSVKFSWFLLKGADYDDDYKINGVDYMCEDCGEKYLNLTALDFCIQVGPGISMDDYMAEYHEITGFNGGN